jgi:putative PIN family toxin of toxin-antitoxin system
MPPRAVFDTNVYISIFAFPEKPLGSLLDLAVVSAIDLFVCPFILEEFRRVVGSKFHFSEGEIDFFEDRILDAAKLIHPSEKVAVIEAHEEDNRILECAVAAKADYLVSGDRRHLVPLKRFRGTSIIPPAEFLRLLAKNGNY